MQSSSVSLHSLLHKTSICGADHHSSKLPIATRCINADFLCKCLYCRVDNVKVWNCHACKITPVLPYRSLYKLYIILAESIYVISAVVGWVSFMYMLCSGETSCTVPHDIDTGSTSRSANIYERLLYCSLD